MKFFDEISFPLLPKYSGRKYSLYQYFEVS
jgi:hypothetical protein